jgi:2-haloacid dehalogenase
MHHRLAPRHFHSGTMNKRFKFITFDVYTALFDIQGSLTPEVARALGPGSDAATLVRTWRAKQLEYALISNSLGRERISFRTATQRALEYTLARAGLSVPEITRDELVKAWDELQPWPEANEVLAGVKARGLLIGLLSNGDEAMLEALARRLGTAPDHIFASERAGHYKPHPSVYALPFNELGITKDELLHVAGSPTDVLGTKSAGLYCAWSNRHGEVVLDPSLKPDYEFSDLRGVLGLL